MIRSFRHKGLQAFHHTGSTRGIQAQHAKKLRLILGILDHAATAADLNLPNLRAHPLQGNRAEFWSVWVNGNWRVTFRFVETDVELLDYEDYH